MAALAAVVIVLILLILPARNLPLRSEMLRQRIVSTLAWRLNRDVTLDQLSLRLFPRLSAEGTGLVIRERGRDTQPLISIRRFTVDADLLSLVRHRVPHVELVGLNITVRSDTNEDPTDPLPVVTSGSHPRHESHAGVASPPDQRARD